jgi:hypothetical protein
VIDDGRPLAPEGPIKDGCERRFSDEELEIVRERGYRQEQHEEDVRAWVSEDDRSFWGEDVALLGVLAGARMRDHELLLRLEWLPLKLLELLVTELAFNPGRSPDDQAAAGVGLPVRELTAALRRDEDQISALLDELAPWKLSTCRDSEGVLWLVVANRQWLPIPSQCWREVIVRECRAAKAARKAPRSRLSPLAS